MRKKNKSPGVGKVRKFRVTATCEFDLCIDEGVIKQGCAPDDPIFGGGASPDLVAQHIAYNMVVNQCRLSEIDGFANCRDSAAVAVGLDSNWDIEVRGE